MLKVLFALLLVFVCGVECGASQFPCSNEKVIFAFDVSNSLSAAEFTKETDFLVDYVFESWNHFESLAIFGYAGDVNGHKFGDIKSKAELKDFIRAEKQLKEDSSICALFTYLNSMRQDNMNIIVFISNFDTKEINTACKLAIKGINEVANKITFIPLNSEVTTSLITYFPTSTIVEWDINNEEVPEHWEQIFWGAYGCNGPVPS